MPRLKTKYQQEIAPALMQKIGYKSPMQIPRLEKIVVNVGCGEARDNAKASGVQGPHRLTGQRAVVTRRKVRRIQVREVLSSR